MLVNKDFETKSSCNKDKGHHVKGEATVEGDDFIREAHTATRATSPALAVRIVAWANEERGSHMTLTPTWHTNCGGFRIAW